MPSMTKPVLTLTLSGSNVTIKVTYTIVFTPFERFLATSGLIFREEIRVIGEDPGVATDILPIARNRSITVSRASLQEDVGSDNDELSCMVTVTPIGLPTQPITLSSAEQSLAG